MSLKETERLLALAHDRALNFLRELPDRRVEPSASIEQLRAALNVPLPDEPADPVQVLDQLERAANPGLIASAGPRFFGFVIGGSLPVTVAADWLTAAWDQNAGLYSASPAASVAEETAARWLLEIFGLPSSASVGFVTGCQMANFTALAAARHAVLRKSGWDVEERGLNGAPRINVLVSAESHVTIGTSLRMLGLGAGNAIKVEPDDQGRMRSDALGAALQKIEGPTIVCAQAGNVNTGAFDPLRQIALLAHERGAWVHVDGAFGLWAAVSPSKRNLLEGVELADSWATDAHKWLNVPYDSGIVIVRDPTAHLGATSVKAAYLVHSDGRARDPLDFTPEFSRRARGFTVYAALRSLGRRGLADLVDRCCQHAWQFARELSAADGVEILNEVVLNQVLVRFHDSDELTDRVTERVRGEGTCWLSGTNWHGKSAMRISVSNWSTTSEDVTVSADAMLSCLADELVSS